MKLFPYIQIGNLNSGEAVWTTIDGTLAVERDHLVLTIPSFDERAEIYRDIFHLERW